jgi:hypothetical protein
VVAGRVEEGPALSSSPCLAAAEVEGDLSLGSSLSSFCLETFFVLAMFPVQVYTEKVVYVK